MFCILTLLIAIGFKKQYSFKNLRYKAIIWSFSVCVIYSGIIEVIQGLPVVDRSADVYDFIANIVGCGLGIFFFRLIYGKDLINYS